MKCVDWLQYSDMAQCKKCGQTWDMNDPDPPDCSFQLREYEFNRVRHNPPETYGDCLRACVKSLLGGDPPHFFHDGCDGDIAFQRLNAWLKPQGLTVAYIFFNGETSLADFLSVQETVNPTVPAILVAQNRHGEDHCVCLIGGTIVHNPDIGMSPITQPNSNGFWNLLYFVKL